MTRDEIIRMAREAGAIFHDDDCLDDCAVEIWARFAALVAAAEREACALLCDAEHKWLAKIVDRDGAGAAAQCAYKIRARGDA